MDLNYHHLRYFFEVARDGQLTRTAVRLNVSQSALSSQIRTLEARLGHDLFDRVGRQLKLTEEGRIAYAHAEQIFATGEELLATLSDISQPSRPLRVGSLSTLSRNFQLSFLRPVLGGDASVVLRSGDMEVLLIELVEQRLDVVLATAPPQGEGLATQRITEQSVELHAVPARLEHSDLSSLLASEPLILPTDPSLRGPLQALFDRLGVTPHVVADVDDMALIRLLTREGVGVAAAPAVVVADEVAAGRLATAPFALGVSEPFYAVTARRRFPHPALRALLSPEEP
ncbi:MAG: LysR family transcriptional regulator [Pseudomonadota bacterium]